MTTDSNRYQLAPGVLAQAILDEAVLLDAHAGAYFSANASASLILQVLIDGKNEQAMIERLVARFVVDQELATRDVRACLADWLQRGLIVPRL